MKALGETPTIEEVFNNLTTNIQRIKSCSMETANGLTVYYKRNDLNDYIFGFPSHIAIAHINLTLKEIEDVRLLGDKIVRGIKKQYEGDQDGVYDPEPGVTEDDLKRMALAYFQGFLVTQETLLLRLKSEIIARAAFIEDDSKKNLSILTPTKTSKKQKQTITRESFEYLDYDTQPDNVKLLHDGLIRKGFIHKNTSLPAFRKLFSGDTVSVPIIWTGNLSELVYFIKLIHNEYKRVRDTKQNHFKIAAKCFVQADGSSWDWAIMRRQKDPSKAKELIPLAKLL